ncbi:MAG TPA: metal ABC transporter permease [Herpetosiphonaceae bacterium]
MSTATIIILTGVLAASACALLGTFLVLRKMAMLSDAISHAILPGLVGGYFLANGPNLLAGFLGAAAAGIVTVTLVESLQNTGRVGGESAIGIVFPAMFALGTFLVSKYFANVHLDTDAILYGNIEFASFDTLIIGGANLGPQSLWVMGGLCVVNLLFVALFYKELKLATFDAGLAATLGFSPVLIHYALMAVVSVTTVGAFTAVGAILVVALMIVPAATAYLLTDRLPLMIGLAVLAGALSALGGYWLALAIDGSIAGAIASMTGALFGLALLFSPAHGLVAKAARRRRQREQFATEMLVVHLLNHEGTDHQHAESNLGHLTGELRWSADFARETIRRATRGGLIECPDDQLALTAAGRQVAAEAMRR